MSDEPRLTEISFLGGPLDGRTEPYRCGFCYAATVVSDGRIVECMYRFASFKGSTIVAVPAEASMRLAAPHD